MQTIHKAGQSERPFHSRREQPPDPELVSFRTCLLRGDTQGAEAGRVDELNLAEVEEDRGGLAGQRFS